VSDQLERVSSFMILSYHFPADTEENYRTSVVSP
jgi:hypothetical protein